mmetsp:Transcript_31126/g.92777  ORF Transcript_31126/g.92777 Transcript_31126/m.92777 type:complete len:215 (-) Transcript_31126:2498-3142(-)
MQDSRWHPADRERARRAAAGQEAARVPLCVCVRVGVWRLHARGQGVRLPHAVLQVVVLRVEERAVPGEGPGVRLLRGREGGHDGAVGGPRARVPVHRRRLCVDVCEHGRDDAADVLFGLARGQPPPRHVRRQHGHGQISHHAQQAQEHERRGDDVLHDLAQLVLRRAGNAGHHRAAAGEEVGRALRPARLQAPRLLCRRPQHAVCRQVRHAVGN